jgi:plastocyanin
MNLRGISSALAGFLLVTLGCGSGPTESPTNAPSSGAQNVPSALGQVVGKLPPELTGSGAVVVVLESAAGGEIPIAPQPAIMDQAGYEFLPGLLLAQSGQTVQFRNSEDVLHNVRVTEVATETPIFNVATLPFGSYDYKFERPGFYSVTCDIHSTMRADILVTATPYTAKTATNGSFTIAAVPPGTYTLTAYAGAGPIVRSVEVKSGATDLGVIR